MASAVSRKVAAAWGACGREQQHNRENTAAAAAPNRNNALSLPLPHSQPQEHTAGAQERAPGGALEEVGCESEAVGDEAWLEAVAEDSSLQLWRGEHPVLSAPHRHVTPHNLCQNPQHARPRRPGRNLTNTPIPTQSQHHHHQLKRKRVMGSVSFCEGSLVGRGSYS
eukprot:3455032-Rhodomonas_salina.3